MKYQRTTFNSQPKARLKSAGKIVTGLWLAFWIACTATAAPIVTITPADPSVSSCLAFGAAPGSGVQGAPDSGFVPTSPFMGFIYKDVPAFDLNQRRNNRR